MTYESALALVRDTLRGQEITSEMINRPVPAFTVVSREALATLVDADWSVRPLGVLEAEAKRERAEQGTDARSVTSENGSVGHISQIAATDPAPIPCAECGAPLTKHEVERKKRLPECTKYHGICNECVRLKAGLV